MPAHFIVATDLSARSDRALERAVHLLDGRDARLTVIHVIDDELPAALSDMQETYARKSIEDHVADLAGDNRSAIEIQVLFGKPYAEILGAADKLEADMIVLGLHREDALKDMFLGTTAERTMRGSRVPVLLVRDRPSNDYARILVGIDFSQCSRVALRTALALFPRSALSLVHAFDVPFRGFLHGSGTKRMVRDEHDATFKALVDQELAAVTDLLPASPEIERILDEGTAGEVLTRQVKRLQPDLLVLGTHGRTGVAHAFFGSVAETFLRAPPCDVLAIKSL
ncbi:MAG: universal stress protein [Azospirillaceae bacterium]